MKRKSGDRGNWDRILASRFCVMRMQEAGFHGIVTLYCIDVVREPLWVTCAGRRVCIADAGYTWLQQYPIADGRVNTACYTLTTMFDEAGDVTEWYIDICGGIGVGDDGVPWHDDLYLDIVRNPITGRQEVVDADELDDALAQGKVSDPFYHAAWRETHRLAPLVAQGALPEMRLAVKQRATLLKRLPVA